MIKTQLNYLHKLERFKKIKPGLATMWSLMKALGNPQDTFPSIHIAGTNGKGSTAAFLSSILNQTSLKVGLYTSPHLHRFNERIVINNQPVSDNHLSNLINQVRKAAATARVTPTYFEFTTAIAFLYLARQKVDIAIIEVGMGGDLDATNVITPILSIITNISLDHTQWLGQTKLSIAKRKAGIIKNKIPLITAEENPDIIAYLKNECAQKKALIHILQKMIITTPAKHTLSDQTFSTNGVINDTFTIPLLGQHQITNASTALLATQVFKKTQPRLNKIISTQISTHKIKKGLSSVQWSGRFDIVSKQPFILIDGAHNEQSVFALASVLDSYHLPHPDILVLGIKDDKDPKPFLDNIVPRFRKIIVTEAKHHPTPAKKLAKQISESNTQVSATTNLAQAIDQAKKDLKPNTMLLITGSLYLAGDALSIIKP